MGEERQVRLSFIDRINLVPVISLVRFYQTNPHQSRFYFIFFGEIFGNIVLFAPFGFFVKWLYPWQSNLRIVVYGLLLSVGIEFTQLFLQIGICDVDDVILNTIGTAAGVFFCTKMISRLMKVKNY